MIKYKVGDKVRIKEREGSFDDYPFGFVDVMSQQRGKIFTIEKIVESLQSFKNFEFYNGDNHYYLFVESNHCYWWHSSMFEPVIEKENINYNYGDSIKVLEYSGKIGKVTHFFVDFETSSIDHADVCSKIRERCSDFCEIARNTGAIEHIDTENCFPEFPTVEQLVAFVNKINELYSQKPFGESKQLLTTQKTKEHEIRFQKPKASYIRGNVPAGRTICGRRNKTAIKLGHLSNKACHF